MTDREQLLEELEAWQVSDLELTSTGAHLIYRAPDHDEAIYDLAVSTFYGVDVEPHRPFLAVVLDVLQAYPNTEDPVDEEPASRADQVERIADVLRKHAYAGGRTNEAICTCGFTVPGGGPAAIASHAAEMLVDAISGPEPRTCRVCGCTDDDCSDCIERVGQPCFWVEPDLCSACINEPTVIDYIRARVAARDEADR